MIHILYVLYIHRHFDVIYEKYSNSYFANKIIYWYCTVPRAQPRTRLGSGDHFLPMRTLSIL